jgi:hypothetical protein
MEQSRRMNQLSWASGREGVVFSYGVDPVRTKAIALRSDTAWRTCTDCFICPPPEGMP